MEGVIPTEVSFVDEHLDYFGAKKSEATPVDRELFFSDLKSVAGVIVAVSAMIVVRACATHIEPESRSGNGKHFRLEPGVTAHCRHT